ncbi:GNAT family N-acetyltransferase [Arthrobacter sp. B1805]|uniref:GNAT family N-acetyltransferase n=1 Tax=Arthrobacter sp. B1805 TaxID=2058892 RepID=UPI0015E2C90F|nr:N-acetyltransferase [Arthrobacter sp. B1805]
MPTNPFGPVRGLSVWSLVRPNVAETVQDDPGYGQDPARTIPVDLSTMSTRQLRVLSNALYRDLDTKAPPFGTCAHYQDVSEELKLRETEAAQHLGKSTSFRDNPLRSRFELFSDGDLVGTLTYTLRAGHLTLQKTLVTDDIYQAELEADLIRRALLNAHRRRLAVRPYCPQTRQFLNDHPQFRSLVPRH